MTPTPVPVARRARVPLAVWITLAVIAAHALVFWVVADKRFLPKTRYLPPPAPAVNFGAAEHSSVAPGTGEVTTEQDFTVSTRLATPPSPTPVATGKKL